MTKPTLFTLALAMTIAACSGTSHTSVSIDEQFGHRFEGTAPDGRETHEISPPESGQDYAIHPAVFDSIYIRPQFDAGDSDGQNVEVLIKGSFPDSCTELHSAKQERAGNIINVSLDMRRPRSTLCASVVRPYRFYLLLEGLYPAGNYTLKINGTVRAFTIAREAS